MKNYLIRPFQKTDLSDLVEIDFFREGVARKLLNSIELQKLCFVAVNNFGGEVVGFVCGEKTLLSGYMLYAGEVKTEHRKKGIFSSLLSEFEKQCAGDFITIYHNELLDAFYEKRGYMVGKNLNVSIKEISEEKQ